RLLAVLLSEERDVGADDVEELHAHGGDAAEVTGTGRGFPAKLLDLDPGPKSLGIHRFRRRHEQHVYTRLRSEPRIALLVTGVQLQILVRTELGRIDEQRDDHRLALAT